jgi:hypothetical protein
MRRPRQVQSHLGTGENPRAQERVAVARRSSPRTRGGSIRSRPGRHQSRGRVAREGFTGVPGQRRALGAGGQSGAAAAAKGEIRRRVETVRTVSLPYPNTQLPPNYHPITTRLPTNPPLLSTDATTTRGSSRPSPRSSRPIARLTRRGPGSTARARWTRTSATTGRRTTASRRSTAATKWRRRWRSDARRPSPSTGSCGSA